MEHINVVLAKNLKAIRDRKKLSLDKVAEVTGVSKAMLGQIERGESNPTIGTVWKIANGLKISFTSLINDPTPDSIVLSKTEVQALVEDDGKFRVYPFFPFEDGRPFEMYSVEVDPGGSLRADAHREGTEEFITVFEGELTITFDGDSYTVRAGDAIRLKADKPHTYLNSGASALRLSMAIHYPG